MTRTEALKFLVAQVTALKEKHVSDLMKKNRIDELWEIAQKVKISPLLKFCRGDRHLDLRMSEIPNGCHYELAFYISQSTVLDHEVFANYKEFIELLKSTNEDLADRIANIMVKHNLSDCTIPELLRGEIDAND